MAATSTTAPKAQETKKPTTVVVGEYKGKPTLNVCPEDSPFTGLSAGLPKWTRLFGLDKDGDSCIAEVFKQLYAQADKAGREKLVNDFCAAVEAINQFLPDNEVV